MTFGLCLACGREDVLLDGSGWRCLDCQDKTGEDNILKRWASDTSDITGLLIIPSLKDFREDEEVNK